MPVCGFGALFLGGGRVACIEVLEPSQKSVPLKIEAFEIRGSIPVRRVLHDEL